MRQKLTWICFLCNKTLTAKESRNYKAMTYFCRSHGPLIQGFISAKGDEGAELWLDRSFRIHELVMELKEFAEASRKPGLSTK